MLSAGYKVFLEMGEGEARVKQISGVSLCHTISYFWLSPTGLRCSSPTFLSLPVIRCAHGFSFGGSSSNSRPLHERKGRVGPLHRLLAVEYSP